MLSRVRTPGLPLAAGILALTLPIPKSSACLEGEFAREIQGEWRVVEVRMSQATPHMLGMRDDAQQWLDERGEVADGLAWRGGMLCYDWLLTLPNEPPPADPAVEEIVANTPNSGVAKWIRLTCRDGAKVSLFLVDSGVLLEQTANGIAWLIWERERPTE